MNAKKNIDMAELFHQIKTTSYLNKDKRHLLNNH